MGQHGQAQTVTDRKDCGAFTPASCHDKRVQYTLIGVKPGFIGLSDYGSQRSKCGRCNYPRLLGNLGKRGQRRNKSIHEASSRSGLSVHHFEFQRYRNASAQSRVVNPLVLSRRGETGMPCSNRCPLYPGKRHVALRRISGQHRCIPG